jgi:hypothetical protein
MVFTDLTKISFPLSSSNPVKIFISLNLGINLVMSSSSVKSPPSTHCRAAIEVTNLVELAYKNVASSCRDSTGSLFLRERTPKALA